MSLWAAAGGAKLFYVFPHLLSNRCSGGRRRRGVFVGPSDNLCTDSTAATCRWNVNTFWLSGSSHICLHPSTCPDPALHHPRFSFLSPLLSLRIPLNPNSWQNQMVLLRRLRRFICPPCGTAFAFLLAFFSPFFRSWPLFIMSLHWFSILWNREAADPQLSPSSVPQIVMDAHAEAKLLNYPIRHLALL